jgi:SAM-dependent methyltransferase
MKRATAVRARTPYQEELRGFDLREIDNPDPRALFRLKYLARLETVLHAIETAVTPGAVVAEVGCSQANLSLLLAERGYRAVAVDLLPDALSYALQKRETGRFWPLAADAGRLPLADGALDAIVLGEVLEHCPDPAAIVGEGLRALRPGGLLIATTPNRTRHSARLPSYGEYARDPSRYAAELGPHGDHHLFTLDQAGLRRLLADCGVQATRVRLVGSPLMSDRLKIVKRLLPVGLLYGLSRLLCGTPGLGGRVGYTLVAAGRK